MSELRVIKLVNGDEVIGFVEYGQRRDDDEEQGNSADNLIFIKGPMRVVQEYDRNSRGHSLFLIDWMPSAGSNVLPIPKDKIITIVVPGQAVEEHYLELMLGHLSEEELAEEFNPEEEKKRAELDLLKKTKFDDEDMN